MTFKTIRDANGRSYGEYEAGDWIVTRRGFGGMHRHYTAQREDGGFFWADTLREVREILAGNWVAFLPPRHTRPPY